MDYRLQGLTENIYWHNNNFQPWTALTGLTATAEYI